ncbi:MAG TPA: 30S ribosomal protein S7 [Candidatus Paceibacterota bacterium]|nr:30S ribosomal protein S7 [Candidatus Paceibacterota bacterium]
MRRPVKKRIVIEPDLKYQSVLVSKLINRIMREGKKAVSMRIVYNALDILEQKTKKPAMEALEIAISNAGPNMELKSRRIGGANYQVPIEVKPERRTALAIRWMIEAARSAKGKPMEEKFAEEMLNAFNNTGGAVKKKLDTHRMADANKAFAHFAW